MSEEEFHYFPIIYEPGNLTEKRMAFIHTQMEIHHKELSFLTRDYSDFKTKVWIVSEEHKVKGWRLRRVKLGRV